MTRDAALDWTGRTLRLEVDRPAAGGESVARHEGRVVFVSGALPGETVDARVVSDPGRGFCRAEATEIHAPSAARIRPACDAAAHGAGCCDWSFVDPGAARGLKATVLADQLVRLGRLDPDLVDGLRVDPLGDGSAAGWRTSARWITDAEGRPGLRRARSDDVVARRCAQPPAELSAAVESERWDPGVEVLGTVGDDGTLHLADRAVPSGRGGAGRGAASRRRARAARPGPWRPRTGASTVLRRAAGRELALPLGSFWQAHRDAPAAYAAVVSRAAEDLDPRGERLVVWDLYAGAGLFAAAALAARPGSRVVAVEADPSGAPAFEAAFAGDPGVTRVGLPVERFAAGPDAEAPDLVVLDPPRAGAGRAVLERVAASGATRIVHVGCDVASFARDVGTLVGLGWTPTELRGFDAFPGTHHVEAVAVLEAPSEARRAEVPAGAPS